MDLRSVARAFDLSPVRARSALRAAIFHFAFVAAVTGLKSATNAVYLARREPSDLPWLYLGTAAIVTVVTGYLSKRLGVVSAKFVLRRALLVAGVIGLVLATLAARDVRASLGVLYVYGEACATALSVLFWARLGEVFDVRAAKRVFGAIAAAGMAGATLGGLSVKLLAELGLPAVSWCFAAPVVLIATRPLLGAGHTPGSIRRERTTLLDGLSYAGRRRFPLGVAALVLMFAIHAASIDFAFRTGTHRFEGGSETGMAAMFGVLNAVVGVLSIAFQSAITARLLSRLGVFAYLSVVPMVATACAAWALALPASFVPLFVMKVIEMMGSYSLNQTGLQLLYNPLPSSVRGSVRALIDGAVKKLGGAVGGLLLLALGAALGPTELLLLVVGLGLALLAWVRGLRPLYLQALEEKLGDRGLAPIPVIDPSERATRQKLEAALVGDAASALNAIAVLEREPDFDFRHHVRTLIAHPAEEVRKKAIELIERAPNDDFVPFLVEAIQSPGRRPRAQAARLLVMIDPVTARRVLEPVLRAPGAHDHGLVAAAIAAMLGGRETEPAPEGGTSALAHQALEAMLARADAAPLADRAQLAELLGLVGSGPYAKELVRFLGDAAEPVRRAAIHAAALARDPSLPPLLVRMLDERPLQPILREALAAYGDEIGPLLGRTLDDRRIDVSLRVQVPRILGLIGTEKAAGIMLFSNRHDDAYLRYVIVEELARMRRRRPELVFDVARAHEAAVRRLRAYAHYRPFAADLRASGADWDLLARAVSDRVRQNLHAALRVLGLLYDQKAMENAFFGLEAGEHSDAVELVDVALAGSEVRAEVLAAIEPIPPRPVAARAEARARALCEGRDVQLAMIASESMRRLGLEPPEVREPTSGEPLMPKSIVDRVFLLQHVQFFRGLSVDDLAAVAGLCSEGHAEPREAIYEEGELGDSMYVIISGGIHLSHGDMPLLDLHAGDSFGQTSVLDGGLRPVTARAGDEGVDFMRLERQPLLDLMADRPGLVSGLFVELGVRIRELIELTGGHGPADGRGDGREPSA